MSIAKLNKNDTLGERMKSYESLSTSRSLMPNTPVYARIDGRAFHTFCRGLSKPYSTEFIEVMQEVTKGLIKSTNAILGYVQSDEISLGWIDTSKAPFDGRIQKLESTLASTASALFVYTVLSDTSGKYESLKKRCSEHIPTFDCRIFNVPSMIELANSFLWRENDAIKNSVSSMSRNFYSDKELHKCNTDDKIHMMRMKGYCFYEDTPESFLRGTFFQRQTYNKIGDNGIDVIRSHIVKKNIPYRLTDIENKVGVLFENEIPIKNKVNVTFDLGTNSDAH